MNISKDGFEIYVQGWGDEKEPTLEIDFEDFCSQGNISLTRQQLEAFIQEMKCYKIATK